MVTTTDTLKLYCVPGTNSFIGIGRLKKDSLKIVCRVGGFVPTEKKSHPELGVIDVNSIVDVFRWTKAASMSGGSNQIIQWI